jgi:hypothetical protein
MSTVPLRALVASLLGGALFVANPPAHAPPLTIVLARDTGSNPGFAGDTAGWWLHDGGTVTINGGAIGRFVRSIRVTVGSNAPHDIAMLTISLFLSGGDPPENCTAQGVHRDRRDRVSTADAVTRYDA